MTIKVTDSRTEALGADAAALPVGVYDHPLDGAPVLVVEEAGSSVLPRLFRNASCCLRWSATKARSRRSW